VGGKRIKYPQTIDSTAGRNRESAVSAKDAFHNLATGKNMTVTEWKKSLSGMRGKAANWRSEQNAKRLKKQRGERY
jgi:hypothetical protein